MSVDHKDIRRSEVFRLLGAAPGSVKIVDVTFRARAPVAHGQCARLVFKTADDVDIPAILLTPETSGQRGPAILYCHAHGNRYDIGMDELCAGRPALTKPYADDLLKLGFTVLCMEMPCFGSRAQPEEDAAAKAALWHGRTLFGQMLTELLAGIDYLASLPEVDAKRIATLGISMGGTHAWWLGALDERIKAVVHMCCFADMAGLIEIGAHQGHGNYMTVPGLLNLCSTGELAGLMAPRAQLVCVGMQDWSTPSYCFDVARNDLERAYARQSAENKLAFHIEQDHGHEETPLMRERVLDFLSRNL